jgi:hypothetical protein
MDIKIIISKNKMECKMLDVDQGWSTSSKGSFDGESVCSRAAGACFPIS